MKRVCAILLVIGCTGSLLSPNLYAQKMRERTASKNSAKQTMWFELAGGAGFVNDQYDNGYGLSKTLSGIFGLHVQFKRHLFSIKLSGAGDLAGYGEAGILYGRVISDTQSKLFTSVSTGISVVTEHWASFGGTGTSETYGIGLPIQLSFNHRPYKDGLGIGTSIFGNINTRSVFMGITLSFQFGHFRDD